MVFIFREWREANMMVKRKTEILLALLILFSIFTGGFQTTALAEEKAPVSDLQNRVNLASDYLITNGVKDWDVIVPFKKAGKEIPSDYLSSVIQDIKDKNGELDSITTYEGYTMGILAAGGEPTNVSGYNLIESIYNQDVTSGGALLNGAYYALIALDSGDFETPESALWNREKLINEILNNQFEDGSWSYNNQENGWFELDTTAQVITSLAPYYQDQVEVKTSVDKALQYITSHPELMNNSSTAAAVIVALSAIGKDANSNEFAINGIGLVDYLLSFQNTEDGGFSYMGGISDSFSTKYAFPGLVAYQLYLNNKGSLYNLAIPGMDPEQPQQPETPLPEQGTPVVQTQPEVQTTTVAQIQTAEPKVISEQVQEGKVLPNTATNIYNVVAVGLLLIVMGSGYYIIGLRKKV